MSKSTPRAKRCQKGNFQLLQ